jgi:hypothetical protein
MMYATELNISISGTDLLYLLHGYSIDDSDCPTMTSQDDQLTLLSITTFVARKLV